MSIVGLFETHLSQGFLGLKPQPRVATPCPSELLAGSETFATGMGRCQLD
jgi:hypothetical protein